MALNIKTYSRCGVVIQIDINNPDPVFKTHCAVCMKPLCYNHKSGGYRKISDDALFAICHHCSMFDRNGKRVIMTPEELSKDRVIKRKASQVADKDRIRKRIAERDGKVTMRPCGCGIKGRHRDTCDLSKNYKTPGRKKRNVK